MSNRLFVVYCSLSVLTMAAAPLRAAEPVSNTPPVVTVPVSATAPKLDGAIGANEWAGPVVQGFYQPNADQMDRRGGRFALACDGTNLFVAVDTPVHPRYGPVLRNRHPYWGEEPDQLVYDDSLEIWAVAGLAGDAEYTYQIMFNARGSCAFRKHMVRRSDFGSDGWEAPGLKHAGSVRDGRWTVECAIPLAVLGVKAPAEGVRIRVCRNYLMPFVQTRDNRGVVYYKQPSTMMPVRFAERAPQVSEPDWMGVVGDQATVTVRNLATEAMKVLVGGQTIELPAGAAREMAVPVTKGENDVRQAEVLVTTPDGAVIHRRTARWSVSGKPVWEEVL